MRRIILKTLSLIAVTCSLAGSLWAGSAHAQFAKPEDAVKYRQSAFTLMGSHMGRMQPVIKGQAPYDAAAIKANVAILKTLSGLPWAGFTADSKSVSSSAKPDVWSDAAGFKAAQDKFNGAMTKLVAAADSGDLEKLRAAYGDVGASCKACHDTFRAKN